MKIIKTRYDYELEASNQIAHFKNRLAEAIWKNVLPETSDKYHQINSALFKVVDEVIGVLGASYEVDMEAMYDRRDIPQDYIVGVLSTALTRELMKSDIAYISKRNTLLGGNRYVVTIPFIKTVAIGNTRATAEGFDND